MKFYGLHFILFFFVIIDKFVEEYLGDKEDKDSKFYKEELEKIKKRLDKDIKGEIEKLNKINEEYKVLDSISVLKIENEEELLEESYREFGLNFKDFWFKI